MATTYLARFNFDVTASLSRFNDSKSGEAVVPEPPWEATCRPILVRALIDRRTAIEVLLHLDSDGVPLGAKEKSKARTVHRWLARARDKYYFPKLPPGGKTTNPGYLEALKRWKSINGTPTDQMLLDGWEAKPVDYSGINFLSATDPFAPPSTNERKRMKAESSVTEIPRPPDTSDAIAKSAARFDSQAHPAILHSSHGLEIGPTAGKASAGRVRAAESESQLHSADGRMAKTREKQKRLREIEVELDQIPTTDPEIWEKQTLELQRESYRLQVGKEPNELDEDDFRKVHPSMLRDRKRKAQP